MISHFLFDRMPKKQTKPKYIPIPIPIEYPTSDRFCSEKVFVHTFFMHICTTAYVALG